ncbi:MAG TPA: glycosyltransferase family 39 protein [Candidatus Acidoferrales bacterium]|jgi:4-amino-4-deoxy-L-arabinose transferase-like glycosyltransferase|nr:glycosyltransferase family 39 protein [Candidatus Acidoferrales bacterium]
MRANAVFAALAGLGLRLYLVLRFPVNDSGDAPFYIELAWNWLKKGVYGFSINGRLTPVDMRVPGYPAFLAAIFALAGRSQRAVLLTQAVLDVVTCFVIALIAARLAPEASRRRVGIAALWLAVLCPFTANYAAVALTEVLVTFLTALAILVLIEAYRRDMFGTLNKDVRGAARSLSPWFLGGLLVGFGTLVRPETPLLLAAGGMALVARWWRPRDWVRLVWASALMAAGLALPLGPWAARNWRTLHEVQFLAPRYSTLPGEFAPLGFNGWTATWLWRFGDVYNSLWKLDDDVIRMSDLPASAFDSPQERARVGRLLDRYNNTLTLTRQQDRAFAELAGERTARDPVRTYVEIPVLRSLALWFTPRIELLPYSGQLRPFATEWDEDREDVLVTLEFIAVNAIYLGLALLGMWVARGRCGWGILVAFILLRTIYIAYFVETPEPRYVLECFPAVIALAAQAFAMPWLRQETAQLSSSGSG